MLACCNERHNYFSHDATVFTDNFDVDVKKASKNVRISTSIIDVEPSLQESCAVKLSTSLYQHLLLSTRHGNPLTLVWLNEFMRFRWFDTSMFSYIHVPTQMPKVFYGFPSYLFAGGGWLRYETIAFRYDDIGIEKYMNYPSIPTRDDFKGLLVK